MVHQMREELKIERQKEVLGKIIKYYTITAEPVSSQLISKEMKLSSATIRNIMYELEEIGLIKQPHISAGRIPTDRGYRIYVDSLMELGTFLELSTEDTISYLRSNSIEDIILKALQLCCKVTSQTGLALFPTLKIKEQIIEKLEDRIKEILSLLYDFEDRLYLDGTHYLAEQPEFRDIEKISSVLKVLENKRVLMELLEEDSRDKGIKVRIGSENKALGFEECSLVTANYNVSEEISGALGVIGPMRMEYEKIVPAVGNIAESLTALFSELI